MIRSLGKIKKVLQNFIQRIHCFSALYSTFISILKPHRLPSFDLQVLRFTKRKKYLSKDSNWKRRQNI